MKYLYNISGKATLTGHHNYMENSVDYFNKIHEKTGEYLAVWGNDFGWGEVSHLRQDVVDAAIEA